MPLVPAARSCIIIALRFGLPAALIIIGILTIAGCVYIPVPEHPRTTQGIDAEESVRQPFIPPLSLSRPIIRYNPNLSTRTILGMRNILP